MKPPDEFPPAGPEVTPPGPEAAPLPEELPPPGRTARAPDRPGMKKNPALLMAATAFATAVAVSAASAGTALPDSSSSSVPAPSSSVSESAADPRSQSASQGDAAAVLTSAGAWQSADGDRVFFGEDGSGWWRHGAEYLPMKWSADENGAVRAVLAGTAGTDRPETAAALQTAARTDAGAMTAGGYILDAADGPEVLLTGAFCSAQTRFLPAG